ncbi:hypothetical protein EV196_104135 [Mariniflexile fucanivorans]|uniref:DUF6565 domain-containing protein n=1 Tax=Mariniflexile fucanivorans TaxID=264023 RepID=A0A4R1RJ15_9FLAO|nr:DUF6565 domain-containing protein [Mariniflexile fucanivorans]TCL66105.1 hypothetical protein EV196_104135 [Mariniflexile fucanivorans]
MKRLKITLGILAASTMLVACNDSQKDMAEKKVDNYEFYIDSVSREAANDAAENWEAIEKHYQEMKTDVDNSIMSVKENSELQKEVDEATLKYEKFKAEVVAEHERMEAENSKMMIRKSLLGNEYTGGDMQFAWINKDNILGVYQNFVDTVEKNKDSYSREDWDEIKLIYEAIDTRKNTVEKEGLSSADNMKIAALKLKFAPMYTVNRMGAKSDENADAKK